jgi:hypothetical protein
MSSIDPDKTVVEDKDPSKAFGVICIVVIAIVFIAGWLMSNALLWILAIALVSFGFYILAPRQ